MASIAEKKKFLMRYRIAYDRARRLAQDLEECEARAMRRPNWTDARASGGVRDLSGYAITLGAKRDMARAAAKEAAALLREVEAAIMTAGSEKEQAVLHYRYISGMSWVEISDRMGYSVRWVHGMHGHALEAVRI